MAAWVDASVGLGVDGGGVAVAGYGGAEVRERGGEGGREGGEGGREGEREGMALLRMHRFPQLLVISYSLCSLC